MAELWPSFAKKMPARDGGSLIGLGGARVTWHVTVNDPYKTTATAVANYLKEKNHAVHIVYNPVSGEIVQSISPNRAGRGLREINNATNSRGTVNIQIEVVANPAMTPDKSWYYTTPRKNLNVLMKWIADWGVPLVAPAGDGKGTSNSALHNRNMETWKTKPGHYAHQNVPDNTHWDMGAFSFGPLFSNPNEMLLKEMPVAFVSKGSIGLGVVRVQKIVGASADGRFGDGTAAKVSAWQKAKGLPQTGAWGANDEKAYNAAKPSPTPPVAGTLMPYPLPTGHFYGVNDKTVYSHSGLKDADKKNIMRIQKVLGISADGMFGPKTEYAVKAFQRRKMLRQVDGKVGPATWRSMAIRW